jgi:hypothetical protein
MPQPNEQAEIGIPSEEPERQADEATESIEEQADIESPRKAREPHEDKGLEDSAAGEIRPPADS